MLEEDLELTDFEDEDILIEKKRVHELQYCVDPQAQEQVTGPPAHENPSQKRRKVDGGKSLVIVDIRKKVEIQKIKAKLAKFEYISWNRKRRGTGEVKDKVKI